MEFDFQSMNEALIKRLCCCAFDRCAVIQISTGEYQLFALSNLDVPAQTGHFRDYVISLAQKAGKDMRKDLIFGLSLPNILDELSKGKKQCQFYYCLNEDSRYEYVSLERLDDELLLAAFGPAPEQLTARKNAKRQEFSRLNSKFQFLLVSATEYFFEIDAETRRCTKIGGTDLVREQEYYDDQIEWFACNMIVQEEREKYKEMMAFEHFLQTLKANSGSHSACFDVIYDNGRHSLKIISSLAVCEDGKEYIYTFAQDISDIKEQEDKNRQLLEISRRLLDISQNDSLTGLYNKAAAHKEITDHLNYDTSMYPGTLFILDVDDFKQFNDKYGHMVGDMVLKYVGDTLRDVFRSSDILCRWGGDEFLVFMKHSKNMNSILGRLRRLTLKMNLFEDSGRQLPISLSIGAAVAKEREDMDTLFHRADAALYEIKNNGKNGYRIV